MSKAAASAIARQLEGASRILITAHRDPDGDSLGCQLAFYEYWTRQLGKKADIVNQGTVTSKYRFLDPGRVVGRPGAGFASRRWDCAVVFECSVLSRIGSVEKLLPPGIPIINIDHHRHNSLYGIVNIVDPEAAACGEMVYDMFRHWKATITPHMANQLVVALMTDTGRFCHPCTKARTLEVTAKLMHLGADLTDLAEKIYQSFSPAQFRLIHHILSKAELRSGGKVCFLSLSIADRKRFGVPMHDLEGLVDYTLSLDSVRLGALLKELGPRKTKASLRSNNAVDVAKLAQRFGGGGHRNAAGCIIDLPLREVGDELVRMAGRLDGRRSGSRGRGGDS